MSKYIKYLEENKKAKTKRIKTRLFAISIFIIVLAMSLIVIKTRHQEVIKGIEEKIYLANNEEEKEEGDDEASGFHAESGTTIGSTPVSIGGGGTMKVPNVLKDATVVLNQAQEIYKNNPFVYCMNSERISCVVRVSTGYVSDGQGSAVSELDVSSYVNGTIYESVFKILCLDENKIKKADNAKDEDEIEFYSEADKRSSDAKIDGLVGYALWQNQIWGRNYTGKNKIRDEQLQEYMWMSSHLEKEYGSGEDTKAYMSVTSETGTNGEQYTGFATYEDNSNAVTAECIEEIFKNTNSTKYDSNIAVRPVQYDICYDNIFSNIETFSMGDINYDKVVNQTDKTLFTKLIQKQTNKKYISSAEMCAADFNNDNQITDADYEIFIRYENDNGTFRSTPENLKAKNNNLIDAEVDTKTAQCMVNQDDRSFLLGPYNVNVKINNKMLKNNSRNAEREVNVKYQGISLLGSSTTANALFIKELLGTNSGQIPENTFAELDGNKMNIAVLDSYGKKVEIGSSATTSGPSVSFIDSDGKDISNDQDELIDTILKGKYFFMRLNFYVPGDGAFYEEYNEQYRDYINGFSIHIDFGLKYIDQFYANRAILKYSDAVSKRVKTLHYENEYVFSSNVFTEMMKDLLSTELAKNFRVNFEDKGVEGKTFDVGEKFKNAYKIKIRDITDKDPKFFSKGLLGGAGGTSFVGWPDNATVYAECNDVGYFTYEREESVYHPATSTWHGPYTQNQGVHDYYKYVNNVLVYEQYPTWGAGSPGYYYQTTTKAKRDDFTPVEGTKKEVRTESEYNSYSTEYNSAYSNGDYYSEVEGGATETQYRWHYVWHHEGSISGSAESNKLYHLKEPGLGAKNFVNSESGVHNKSIIDSHVPVFEGNLYDDGRCKNSRYAVRWYRFEFDVQCTGTTVIGGGTVETDIGKARVISSISGKVVPCTNTVYSSDGPVRVEAAEPWYGVDDTNHGKVSGDLTFIDTNHWQDFEFIADVKYTRQTTNVNIDIYINEKESEYESSRVKFVLRGTVGPMVNIGGKVWIDRYDQNKSNANLYTNVNGEYQSTDKDRDKLYEGIEVTVHEMYIIHKGSNAGKYKEINNYTVCTNANGEYKFYGLNPFSKYYVTFKYNGQIYQPSFYSTNEDEKFRRNWNEDNPYWSYNRNSRLNVSKGYSVAKELLSDRGNSQNANDGINGKLVRISADAIGHEGINESGNYDSNKRAYGLNQRIYVGNGDYKAVNENGSDAIAGQGEYYTYGLPYYEKIDENLVKKSCENGKDGVVTFGDLYAKYRALVAENNRAYDGSTNGSDLESKKGVFTIKAEENGSSTKPKYTEVGSLKYSDIESKFTTYLTNLGVANDEINLIMQYIHDTEIQATSSKNYIGKAGDAPVSKSSLNVTFPLYNYYISEDVAKSTLIKADSSDGGSTVYSTSENPYKLKAPSASTSADQAPTDHYTLLGMVVNAHGTGATDVNVNNYGQGLDYLYTEGTSNITTIPTSWRDEDKVHKPIDIRSSIDYALMEREIADIHIDKDVNQIITTVDGQMLSYQYGNKNLAGINPQTEKKDGNISVIRRANDGTMDVMSKADTSSYNGALVYNRDIRTADYLYDAKTDENSEDINKNLNVYIQYVIAVENTSDVDVYLDSVLDYYDNESMSFDIHDEYCTDIKYTYYKYNETVHEKLDLDDVQRNLYSGNSDGTVNYNYSSVKSLVPHTQHKLTVGEKVYYYVTYKVNKEKYHIKHDNGSDYDYDRNPQDIITKNELDQIVETVIDKLMMDQNLDLDIIRAGKRCIAEIGSYRTYYPAGREVPDEGTSPRGVGGNVAGLVDLDSNPGNLRNIDLYQNLSDVKTKYDLGDNDVKNNVDSKAMSYIGTIKKHKNIVTTREEDDMDQAPTIRLIYASQDGQPQVRVIKGNVFEDLRNKEVEKALIGDGIQANNEDKIAGITVQLVQILTSVDPVTNKANGISGEKIVSYQKIDINDTEPNENTGMCSLQTMREQITDDTHRVYTAEGNGNIGDSTTADILARQASSEYETVVKQTLRSTTNNNGDVTSEEKTKSTIIPAKLNRGEYSFVNVPAGYYYIRFIYGDHHYNVLTNDSTNEVNKLFKDASDKELTIGLQAIDSDGSYKIDEPSIVNTGNEDKANVEELKGMNEKSYNGQDYKSTIYKSGDEILTIGDTKIYPYDHYYSNSGSTVITVYDNKNANKRNYEAESGVSNPVRIVSNIDGKIFSHDSNYNVNNGKYAGSMYTLDTTASHGFLDGKSVAKDVYAYRERANDFGKGYDYSSNTEDGENQVLRNYRAEILASPSKVLTYKNGNQSEIDDLTNNELEQLAKEQKEAIFELEYHTQMVAQTGIIDLSIEREYSSSNADMSNTYNTNPDNSTQNITINDFIIENVNLGLQERPKAQLKLDKKVSNFKLLTHNNTVLADTNKTQNDLLSFEEHIEHGEEYVEYVRAGTTAKRLSQVRVHNGNTSALETVAMALDDELLADAKLEITYELKVTNIGDVDYVDKAFYYYGNEDERNKENNIVKTAAKMVVDYPSNDFTFREDDQTTDFILNGENSNADSIWKNAYGINAVKESTSVGENGRKGNTRTDYNQQREERKEEPEKLVVVRISDALFDNIALGMSENNKLELMRAIVNHENNMHTEAVLMNAEEREGRHVHPEWSFDIINREYTDLLVTYNNILETASLGSDLIPESYGGKIARRNGEEISATNVIDTNTVRRLVLTKSTTSMGMDSDLTFNNLAEITETYNSNGRRMEFSIPGNEEMADQDAGVDADDSVYTRIDRREVSEVDAAIAQKIQLRTPTGEDKSYVMLAATVMIALASIGGSIVLIKKKLNR